LYFAYNNEPDIRYRAYLYAHVHENRELYPDIYANYAEKIERFVIESLTHARTGKWLAFLYRNYVTNEMLNDQNAAALVEIIFGVRITVHRQDVQEILVLYDKGNREITYRINGSEGNIVLYGRDYHLFLVDKEGNRYADPSDYQIERWLKPDRLGRIIAPLVSDRIGFDIWLCENGDDMAAPDAGNLAAYQRIFANDYLKSPYRETVCLNLLRYYQENDQPEPLERMLIMLAPRDIDQHFHEEVLKMMVGCSLYQTANEWLLEIGEAISDTKLLLRILSACIPDEATQPERALLSLAYRAFAAAKYDEKTLDYLARFYNGSLRHLRDIWKAVKDFDLDTYGLSERLLTQMLYSGAYVGERMAIFAHYVASGGRTDLVSAFVAQNARDYFVEGKITDVIIFRQIQKLLEQGEELDFVCHLAYAQYFAENKGEMDVDASRCLGEILRYLVDRDICFAFFREYIGIFPLLDNLIDRAIIEYHSTPGQKVVLRYLFEQEIEGSGGKEKKAPRTAPRLDDLQRSGYVTEVMTEMYEGIFVKQFLLFYGEHLLYYIAEEDEDGQENFTESGMLNAPEGGDHLPDCRYSRIGDIEIARIMQDYETVNTLLAEYQQLDYLTGEMFAHYDYSATR
jgi:hypothetical protein